MAIIARTGVLAVTAAPLHTAFAMAAEATVAMAAETLAAAAKVPVAARRLVVLVVFLLGICMARLVGALPSVPASFMFLKIGGTPIEVGAVLL